MRFVGRWLLFDDGVTRPVMEVNVYDRDGQRQSDLFLIDSGADQTVFNADLLHQLQLLGTSAPAGFGLYGIGGTAAFVVVRTVLELIGDDGRPATIRGEFAAFTDPEATDLSILGRDVLDNFDVIISRRRDEVLLLAPNHHYHVSPA
jgi:hypothetical protein